MSKSEPRTFSRACLTLALMPADQARSLILRMREPARTSVEAELVRLGELAPEEKSRVLQVFRQDETTTMQPPPGTLPEREPPALAPEAVIRLLVREHPRILALVLEQMSAAEASRAFTLLPSPLRQEVARQITSRSSPQTWVLDRLDTWLRRSASEAPGAAIPGRLNRILEFCPNPVAEDLLGACGLQTTEAAEGDVVGSQLLTLEPRRQKGEVVA